MHHKKQLKMELHSPTDRSSVTHPDESPRAARCEINLTPAVAFIDDRLIVCLPSKVVETAAAMGHLIMGQGFKSAQVSMSNPWACHLPDSLAY